MPNSPAVNSTKDSLILVMQHLGAGETPESVKASFRQILRSTSLLEIAHLESELLRENHPPQDLMRLYGLQVEIFREMSAH